jgi:uncharacterized protein GlcG (DUF336 family)
MDGARPITVDIAMNKAYTAASFQQSTDELKAAAGQAWFQSLIVSTNGRVTAGGGAIPIVDAGQVVGAMAVAGGTTSRTIDAVRRRSVTSADVSTIATMPSHCLGDILRSRNI